MIKRLRIKFVVINMTIVTLLLCIILGLVFYFTSANLERESIQMMQNIASQPFYLGIPGEINEDVKLPFFTLQIGPRGELISTGGGYPNAAARVATLILTRDGFDFPVYFIAFKIS